MNPPKSTRGSLRCVECNVICSHQNCVCVALFPLCAVRLHSVVVTPVHSRVACETSLNFNGSNRVRIARHESPEVAPVAGESRGSEQFNSPGRENDRLRAVDDGRPPCIVSFDDCGGLADGYDRKMFIQERCRRIVLKAQGRTQTIRFLILFDNTY